MQNERLERGRQIIYHVNSIPIIIHNRKLLIIFFHRVAGGVNIVIIVHNDDGVVVLIVILVVVKSCATKHYQWVTSLAGQDHEVSPCGKEWRVFGDQCYRIGGVRATHAHATTICQAHAAHLVSVLSTKENNFLSSLLEGKIGEDQKEEEERCCLEKLTIS